MKNNAVPPKRRVQDTVSTTWIIREVILTVMLGGRVQLWDTQRAYAPRRQAITNNTNLRSALRISSVSRGPCRRSTEEVTSMSSPSRDEFGPLPSGKHRADKEARSS